MLTGLLHRTVGCCNNEDCAVHLSSAGDHVLDIVGVAGAVNVCIVTGCGLILNVSGVDCYTSCLFLGSVVDLVISEEFVTSFAEGEVFGDSCGKSGFTMVNVTDGTNINVRLATFKFSLCHFYIPPNLE